MPLTLQVTHILECMTYIRAFINFFFLMFILVCAEACCHFRVGYHILCTIFVYKSAILLTGLWDYFICLDMIVINTTWLIRFDACMDKRHEIWICTGSKPLHAFSLQSVKRYKYSPQSFWNYSSWRLLS